MNAAVGGLAAHHPVMATDGELMLLTATAVGEGVLADRIEFKTVSATRGNAKDVLHHPFPLFTVRRDAAKVLPDQQVRQLMRHHFIDKLLLIFQQQHRI